MKPSNFNIRHSKCDSPQMDAVVEKLSLSDLKVEELLKEVRVSYPSSQNVDSLLSAIRSCLNQIPERQVNLSMAASFVEELGVLDNKATFTFRRPESIDVIGSFGARIMAKPSQTIDLAVRIPKSCFHEKDFLKHRYHVKRALYLAEIHKHLVNFSIVKNTMWTLLHHDARKPLLLFQPADEFGIGPEFKVMLVPVIGQDVFSIAKLAPSRNNLRVMPEIGEDPTPYYNSSILEDMGIEAHCSYLTAVMSQHANLRDAILLLKVWLRKRGFGEMADSLNGFLISMLMAHLINNGDCKISSSMNSFQIFKMFIEILAAGQCLEKGLFLKSSGSKLDKEVRKTYLQRFEVVVIDSLGLYNLAFRLTKDALQEINEAASGTLNAMKGSRDCGFDEVFMTSVEFSSKFDYHVRINMKNHTSKALKNTQFSDKDRCRDIESLLANILKKGLSDRAKLIRVYGRILPSKWSLEQGTSQRAGLPIYVGVLANNFETAYRMVDIGPSADKKDEAAEFRSFWGDKAELRRFKDGTISETAMWECDPTQRHLIIENIVLHLLSRHLSLPGYDVFISAGKLDFAIMEAKRDTSASVPKLLQAFDVLSKRLRGLEDLPLKISSVQPLHAAFRHLATFPPEAHILADERIKGGSNNEWVAACADACDVMVQLEGSGRWPSTPEGIEKTKIAFCLKIAESMQQSYRVKCIVAEDSVDILMHGFCFRLKVYYEKDPTLVQTRNTKGHQLVMDSIRPPPKGDLLLQTNLERDLMLQSLHSSMLSGLQGRYPLYGPVVRLAKRWIGAHLFSDILREEAVELLVAFLFLKPAPHSPPLSRVTGLMRFLQLLEKYDWALSPLIVDLNEDFTAKEINFIFDEFHRVRNQEPSVGSQDIQCRQAAMFIATPYDMRCQTWTALSPSTTALKRLCAYTKSSVELMNMLIKDETQDQWLSLFCTPLTLYDILLKIKPNKLSHPLRVLFPAKINTSAKVIVKSSDDDFSAWIPAPAIYKGQIDIDKQFFVGFDPTSSLLQDLKAKYGESFTYWYDHIGSTVIGINWNKQDSTKKRKRNGEQEQILIEMGKMGEGFIESVHVMTAQEEV